MEHLDEGTIHAWIDGALSATQSREIEAHVAQCPTCSAAVAEARGLIAASSRILTALDDVPGGVVPKRVPGTLPAAATRQAPRWRVSGWVPAAAAAALILAVGLVQANREKGVAEMNQAALDTSTMFRDRLANTVADSVRQPFAAAPQTRPSTGEASAATGGPVGALSRPRDMSLADGRSRAEGRIGGAAGAGATSPLAQRAATPAPPPAPATKDEAVAESKLATLESAPALPATLAGCYRVEREVNQSFGKAANVAGAVSRTTAERARPPAAAPAPAAQARSDFAATTLPNVIRLDTTARPLGLPVLAERSDSVIGWWTRVGRDTAQVRLLSGYAATVTAQTRVACPQK